MERSPLAGIWDQQGSNFWNKHHGQIRDTHLTMLVHGGNLMVPTVGHRPSYTKEKRHHSKLVRRGLHQDEPTVNLRANIRQQSKRWDQRGNQQGHSELKRLFVLLQLRRHAHFA